MERSIAILVRNVEVRSLPNQKLSMKEKRQEEWEYDADVISCGEQEMMIFSLKSYPDYLCMLSLDCQMQRSLEINILYIKTGLSLLDQEFSHFDMIV